MKRVEYIRVGVYGSGKEKLITEKALEISSWLRVGNGKDIYLGCLLLGILFILFHGYFLFFLGYFAVM